MELKPSDTLVLIFVLFLILLARIGWQMKNRVTSPTQMGRRPQLQRVKVQPIKTRGQDSLRIEEQMYQQLENPIEGVRMSYSSDVKADVIAYALRNGLGPLTIVDGSLVIAACKKGQSADGEILIGWLENRQSSVNYVILNKKLMDLDRVGLRNATEVICGWARAEKRKDFDEQQVHYFPVDKLLIEMGINKAK